MDLNLSFFSVESQFGTALLFNAANLLLFSVFFVLILHAAGKPDDVGFRARLQGQDFMYLIWLIVMSATTVWSISAGTSFRAVAPLVVVWFATLFLHQLSTTAVVRIVLIIAVIAALLSIAAVPLFGNAFAYQPVSSTGVPELRGIFDHQLRLGAFLALALGLVLIAKLNGDLARITVKSRVINIACVVLLVTVLVLSRARLYVGDAALALILTALLARRGSRKLLNSILVVIIAVIIMLNFSAILSKLEEIGFDTTLTGRTQIWSGALNGITDESRLLGHGFGTFRLPEFDYLYPANYRASHAHSSYIQALFETGALGLAALVALILVQLVVAWRYSAKSNRYSYSLFLVLYATLGSATGLVYGGARLSPIFGLLMLFIAIESRAIRTSHSSNMPTVTQPRFKAMQTQQKLSGSH